ncbi:MAG: hypothetical protein DRP76_02745 [Candidatus Omnitrophota bacterium]|nr:MAG: hypothetical protein DRP76_02745 [Candidatus Omnitrophota bacterium]
MRSMTAYTYLRKKKGEFSIEIIIKSLNSKYLDIAISHLPPEKILLERKIRELLERNFARGRIEIFIFIKSPLSGLPFLNQKVLRKYYSQIKEASQQLRLKEEMSINNLITLPGVITLKGERRTQDRWILATIKEAIEKTKKFRIRQGKILRRKILQYIKKLEDILKKLKKIKDKAKEKDVSKEDIQEEITLISFYLKRLKHALFLKRNIPVGKKIDFLVQEILRELNASLSKIKEVRLASLIIEAKNFTERIRQQAQNIE